MLDEIRLREIAESGLRASTAEQTEILLIGQESPLTRYSDNYIHQNVSETNYTLTVRAVTGKRIGSASINQLDRDSVLEAVSYACAAARLAQENPDFRSLPGPEPVQEIQAYAVATRDCPADLRAAYVERIVDMAKEKGVTVAGALSPTVLQTAVANSLGVWACATATRVSMTCIAMSSDSAGFAREAAVSVADIDPTAIADRAIAKCLESRNPISVPPGEYDVVLEPPAVADMLMYLAFPGFSAGAYQEGSSFMSYGMGQRITGEKITICDDGYDPQGFPMSFDFEGVPKQKVTLIENGIARGVVYDSLTAGKEGKKSTGHSVQAFMPGAIPANLVMAGGDSSLEEMISSTERGILVTRFHYVNPLHPVNTIITGMTRDGTFLIEKGKITRGIRNLRFTESILGAFSRAVALSKQRSLEGDLLSIVCPAMKIEKFTFTGGTEF